MKRLALAALLFAAGQTLRVGCDCGGGPVVLRDGGAGIDGGVDGGGRDGGPAVCGNLLCDANESCAQCSSDCGSCPSSCTGTGTFIGCRGNGCAVCGEKTQGYTHYFANHPGCGQNNTCAGQFFTCSTNCPAPTSADL